MVIQILNAKELRNTEPAVPIGGHKESLQFLDFETCETAVTHIYNQKADLAGYIENIKRCHRIFLLAHPVFEPEILLKDCKIMVEALPCLVALVIYDYSKELTVCPRENNPDTEALLANRLMAGIPVTSGFLLLWIPFSRVTRLLHNDSQCRCFARWGREAPFRRSTGQRGSGRDGSSSQTRSGAPTILRVRSNEDLGVSRSFTSHYPLDLQHNKELGGV